MRPRHEPDGLGVERRRRQVERDGVERRAVRDRLLLVRDDLLRDRDAAEGELEPESPLDAQRLLDRRLRLLLRLRVPVAVERLDERAARCEVELAHEVLPAEVEVDGALVDGGVGALPLGQPEDVAGRGVHHEERVGRGRAQRDARGRCVLAGPDPAARGVAQLRHVRRALERLRAERRGVAVVDRGLERGRRDVPVEHARVGVVEDRRLDASLEQRRRLAHEVLVERVLRGDEDREAVLAAAGASPLLAEARDRSGEADGDRAVEVADVDAELERVGGRDAEEVALDEPPLDLPPLLRRVAGAVRGEPGRSRGVEPVGWRSGG